MNTVIFDVLDHAALRDDVKRAFETGEPQPPRVSFATPELMFKTLGGRRWELLQTLAGSGPVGIREAARLVGRDVRAVHADIQTLLANGVLNKTDDGKVEFPYEAVHVDFTVSHVA